MVHTQRLDWIAIYVNIWSLPLMAIQKCSGISFELFRKPAHWSRECGACTLMAYEDSTAAAAPLTRFTSTPDFSPTALRFLSSIRRDQAV